MGVKAIKTTGAGEAAQSKAKASLVEVKFLEDFGSYKKDDTAKYHSSTIITLLKKKICEKVK
tara:strand:+ start:3564 stop:3749 length:186 start_codon:yes stop_codon:yes gene_type:complete